MGSSNETWGSYKEGSMPWSSKRWVRSSFIMVMRLEMVEEEEEEEEEVGLGILSCVALERAVVV
jgi:hypothetical protein